MKASIHELLTKGTLGELALGAAQDHVRRLLGEPSDYSLANKANRTVIWRFGSLQLHFTNNVLGFMGVYFREESLQLPSIISLDTWALSHATSVEEFQDSLSSQNIPHSIDPLLTFEEQAAFRVGPGVQVTFSRENDRTCLDSIQFAAREAGVLDRTKAAMDLKSAAP